MITTFLSMAALSHFCQNQNTSVPEQTLKCNQTEIITLPQYCANNSQGLYRRPSLALFDY